MTETKLDTLKLTLRIMPGVGAVSTYHDKMTIATNNTQKFAVLNGWIANIARALRQHGLRPSKDTILMGYHSDAIDELEGVFAAWTIDLEK